MHVRLRLVVDGVADDVMVDVDPATSVGELGAALFPGAVPPGRRAGWLALRIDDGDGPTRVVPPTVTVDGSGLRSGSVVSPASVSIAPPTARLVATLSVLDGPDAPREIGLRPGWNTLGRADDRDVRLTDRLVSKRHARIYVGETIEVVDDGSANGIDLRGATVGRAVVQPADRVVFGATVCTIRHAVGVTTEGLAVEPVVAFNRSPRVDPSFAGLRLRAPEPPRPPTPQRFPLATAIAPVVLAMVLFAVTQSLLTILFFALSPILVVGSWWETRSANRKQLAADTARFRTALGDLARQLEYAAALERSGRCAEQPSTVDVLEAVEARSPLLWTRRPEHGSFGTLRFGLGTMTSRTEVEMPAENATSPELWRELQAVVDRFATVDAVPVVADLARIGNLGVAGTDEAAAPVLRALIGQLVGLHAPGEVELSALAPAGAWEWMRWLPHTGESRLASDAAEAATVVADVAELVRVRTAARVDGDEQRVVPLAVVVVHDRAPVERSHLVRIAEQGPAVGVHVVWFAGSTERLPSACRAFVDVDANTGRGRVGDVLAGSTIDDVAVERLGAAAAERLAMRLAPVIDAGARVDAAAELPDRVALVELLGDEVATSPQAVVDRWVASRAHRRDDAGLRAVVGVAVDGPLTLDLRTQGPHALVGGTTGSGKSEFLQTWILALTVDHPPDRLNLLLVDYKGGAAFAGCVDLPHCVGLVTDLRPHLVRRALASLEAELRRREQLFRDHRVKDLATFERVAGDDAPPSLVIVVDEFAALVAEVPEFVDGVVNIAQRGRSLGLHLVLATQRPAGVVTDNLRANTNLRIALRMADLADAHDVIGSSEAATFDQDLPGRAVSSTGAGRTVTFQTAYSGGHTVGRPRRRAIGVRTLRFGRGVTMATSPAEPAPGSDSSVVAPDIERVVDVIRAAAELAEFAVPRRPWLPELADRYRLEIVPTGRVDDALVFGVADDPGRQRQSTVAFHPDRHGNMAIYGTGGAGKTTALRSLALGAAVGAVRGGPVWVYALDFAAHGLRGLDALANVGAVVAGDDHERVQRLLRFLHDEIDRRAAGFATASASTIVEYRRRTGLGIARMVLLVDGVGAFRTEYEGGAWHAWWERFERIVGDGRALGVHVVMTADRPAAVSSTLASSVQCELVLRLANELDAGAVGGAPDAIDGPPGRGWFEGRVVQVAAAGGGVLAGQQLALERCAASMARRCDERPTAIGIVPTSVLLDDVPADGDRPVIGVDADHLGPARLPESDGVLVAGAPRSGVTTTTATIVRALARHDARREFVLLGARRSGLIGLVADETQWAATAVGVDEVAMLAERLAERVSGAISHALVVVVESVDQLLDTDAEMPVQRLLRACRDHGVYVVADGEIGNLGGSWPLLQLVRAYRCGIVLEPDQMDGETLFKVPFPRIDRAAFPLGRALLVHGSSIERVQVAMPA